VDVKMLLKCFILHATASKNVSAALKILQNTSGLALVAKYL